MKLPKWAPWLLVALALLGNGLQSRDAEYAKGEARRWSDSLKVLAVRQAKVESVYVRQTRTLRTTLTVYDTARVTDTVTRNDTVFVPRAVADNAIAACRATLLTCDERVAIRDQRISTLEQRFKADEAVMASRVPSLTRKGCALGGAAGGGYGGAVLADAQGAAIGAGVGALVGWLACR